MVLFSALMDTIQYLIFFDTFLLLVVVRFYQKEVYLEYHLYLIIFIFLKYCDNIDSISTIIIYPFLLCRMHSDAQFAGSSSVPAHVEMMGFMGMGNNPMVGATVAIAVAIQQAMN